MKKILLPLPGLIVVIFTYAQTNCWQTAVTAINNLNGSVEQIEFANGGTIYAIGGFTNDIGGSYVAYWNGATWKEPGTGLNANAGIYSFCLDKAGHVYTAGQFTDSTVFTQTGNRYVAEYNGASWIKLGTGSNAYFNNGISGLCTDDTGNVYACGTFTNADGYTYIAKWNGTTWSQLGSNFALYGTNGVICIDKNNNIYVESDVDIQTVLPGDIYGVYKWDGNNWNRIGSNSERYFPAGDGSSSPITTDRTGNIIYATGTDTANNEAFVGIWNGSNWSMLGNYDFNGAIWSLVVDTNNILYIGGNFTDSSGRGFIGRWDGNSLTRLYDSLYGYRTVEFVCVDSDNVLYADYITGVVKDECTNVATAVNATASNMYVLNVYPNPTSSQWLITVDPALFNAGTAGFEVYDVSGKVVYQSEIQSPEFEIASPLAPGVYLLRISAPGVNEVRKLVKL